MQVPAEVLRPDTQTLHGRASSPQGVTRCLWTIGHPILLDGACQSCEANELIYPMHYNQFAFVADTEGAGMHRGGLATVREWEIESEQAQLQMRTDRTRTRPWGLAGGHAGAHSRTFVVLEGREREIGKETLMMKKGDILRLQTAGAGGWGDPATREPDAVLRDVVEGKVTAERARKTYRVAVDANGTAVADAETRALREA